MSQAGQDEEAPFGVLVGWEHVDLGERLLVKLQSTRSHPASEPDALDEFRYFMTKNQAVVLANFLYAVSDRLPPAQRKHRWYQRRRK